MIDRSAPLTVIDKPPGIGPTANESGEEEGLP
jgi:hypothetical protein